MNRAARGHVVQLRRDTFHVDVALFHIGRPRGQRRDSADGDSAAAAVAQVLEVSVVKGRGQVLKVLVGGGVLRPGEHFVCGMSAGTVRHVLDASPMRAAPLQSGDLNPLGGEGDEGGVGEDGEVRRAGDWVEPPERRRQHPQLRHR